MIALRGLQEWLRPYAEYAHAIAEANGIHPTVTSVYRSWTEQQRLRTNYERCVSSGQFGRAAGCQYPANRPGDSAHNYGLAWDSTVPAADQEAWDYIRRWVGFEVLDHDRIHAQLPSWRELVG